MTGREEVGSSKETWRAWDELYRRQPRTWRGPAEDIGFGPKHGIIVELGCGTGKTLRSLGGARLAVAIDVSREALKACRVRPIFTNAQLVQSDALSLPISDSSVDAVVAHHVLGHLMREERRKAAVEIARVLRPMGVLSIRVLSRDDMRCGGGKEIEPNTFVKGTGVFCHFFEENEVRDLFRTFEVRSLGRQEAEKNFGGKTVLRSEIVARFIRPLAD